MDTAAPCKASNSVVSPVVTQATSQMYILLASTGATNQTWDLMLPPQWFRPVTLLLDQISGVLGKGARAEAEGFSSE